MSINKISIRQSVTLIILAMIAMRVIIEPSIMFFASGRDGWISYIFALVVQIVGILFIAILIKKHPGKSFAQICNNAVGKVITKIFLFLMLVFFIFKVIGIDYEMQNFLLEAIYDEINWNVFIIPIFLVMIYIAIKGPRVIARLSEIFVPFAVIVLLYTLAIAITSADFSNVLPVFGTSIGRVFEGVFFGISQMGEFLFLFMFMEHIDIKKKNVSKIFLITSIIVSLFIVAFYILFVCVFGDIAIALKEGIIRITQFYPNSDANLRIDGITTVLWLPVCVIMSSICYYCAGKLIMQLFNLKSFNWSVLIVFGVVILSKIFPFITSGLLLKISLNYFSFVSIIIQIVIPLVLIICSYVKEKKNEKMVSLHNEK